MPDAEKHPYMVPIQLAEGEVVVFYSVCILNGDKTEVRMTQHISRDQKSEPAWRANLLRSLADTVELESLLEEDP